MPPELSIIIVHFQKPEMLKLCLDSIQTTISSISHELIVVDSMTMPETQMMIQEDYPEIIFLPYKQNLGYSKAVNIGLKQAQGQYFLILNYDIIVVENTISSLLNYLKQYPDIGLIGPQIRNFNNSIQPSYFRFYTPLTILARRTPFGSYPRYKQLLDQFLMRDTDSNCIQTPDWLMGSAIMLSRQTYETVGGMDERFFMYFEDVDWCRRMWHQGYKVIYYPQAVLYHYLGRASKSWLGIFDALFNKNARWHISSAIKFFLKYRDLAKIQ